MPESLLPLVPVPGTADSPFTFGHRDQRRPISVRPFWISPVTVTQALWEEVVGPSSNPAHHRGPHHPVEQVSWLDLTRPDGFLDRLNAHPGFRALAAEITGTPTARFRLPSEAEWEYAARGGPNWAAQFQFSGGNDVDALAWYQANSANTTHAVGLKASNQLGLFDMCGNVWEWCQDTFVRDVNSLPADGRPYSGAGPDRSLRGGCFHNGAGHCTVAWRYEIGAEYGDPCIGFRLALSGAAA
jgi:formylglycine-generating enzyme required for sulfatase activity